MKQDEQGSSLRVSGTSTSTDQPKPPVQDNDEGAQVSGPSEIVTPEPIRVDSHDTSNIANELSETQPPRTHTDHKTQQRRKVYPKHYDKFRQPQISDRYTEHVDIKLISDVELKNIGNKLCSLHRQEEAIVYYSHAIAKSPHVAIYYSNRALCYLKLQQWDKTICDCKKALELEPNLIKAHFFLGQALLETLNYEDALKHLERAYELAKEKKINFGDDIAQQIRLVKRLYWTKAEDETSKLEDELHTYLIDLIVRDKQRQINLLEQRRQARGSEGSSWQLDASTSSTTQRTDESGENDGQLDTEEQIIESRCDKYSDKLAIMFNDLRVRRRKREVPEYLCGKISFEIMRDPVITPSGITYDRLDIEEHLKRVGHFDPITRQPLRANQLIPNLAMKEVVDAYLSENEWALYH